METSHDSERTPKTPTDTMSTPDPPTPATVEVAPHTNDALAPKAVVSPAVLVVAPHAGNAVEVDHLLTLLHEAGIDVGHTTLITELYEHRPEGRGWRDAGFRSVIAAGGDGTVGTVATHVAESGLPLGILPMGTANDVARSLGIPIDLAQACQVIAAGQVRPIDAGQTVPALAKPGALAVDPNATPRGPDAPSPAAGAYFLHALTLGLNVQFARLATDVARRERWGPLTYATSALEALQHFRPVPVTLRFPSPPTAGTPGEADAVGAGEASESSYACEVVQVVGLNTPVIGGSMNLRVPGVRIGDHLLDFLVIEALEASILRRTVEGLLDAMSRLGERLAKTSRAGEQVEDTDAADASEDARLGFSLPGVRRFRTPWMAIETPTPVDVTMDGEVRTHTPIVVRVAPEPLRVFVPSRETE